jgi:hypothetical protein
MSAIAIFSYYSHRMIRFSLDNIAILLKAYLQYQWNVQDVNSNVQNGDTIILFSMVTCVGSNLLMMIFTD